MDDERREPATVRKETVAAEGSFTQTPTTASPHAVELRIEELVLHGFEPGDRHRIGDSVERALTRLFAERGVPPSLTNGGEVPRLDVGSFHLAVGAGAEAVGDQIARAVYEGLNR
jgi:hypothetical protein